MKGVDWAAHEDPSAMQSATLSPILLLRRSFELVGPIYGPLLILASPGFIISIIAELIPLFGGILNLAYVLIGAPILAGAAFWLVDQHLKQRTPPLGNSLDRAVSRAVPLVFGSILLVLIVSLGMLLFVLPGIYWGVRLAFTPCAIVLEDKGTTEGLGYSWSLVKGRWWGAFWALLIFGLTVVVAFLAGNFIFGFTVGVISGVISSYDETFAEKILEVVNVVSVTVVGNAAATAVAPILNIYTVLLFRSLQQLKGQAVSYWG
ncbi:glycerophosphoryl diester phosphodiesterase membrane domain-containing protein [Synechococcus sp. RC10B2]|uniref:glycerophosphoryl diester phosphodiesterase membrane domain-containing protein n=1 Tax=unclassified Synechococcus TaxID=2626047 RepID=UPI0039C6874D